MKNIYFSASTLGFYISDIHDVFPDDAKQITEETYNSLINNIDAHMKIASTDDGYPILVENTDSTVDYETAERIWRNSELQRTDIELYKVQDSDIKGQGSVSQWREYRKALRNWPEDLNFPNSKFRPTPPF